MSIPSIAERQAQIEALLKETEQRQIELKKRLFEVNQRKKALSSQLSRLKRGVKLRQNADLQRDKVISGGHFGKDM